MNNLESILDSIVTDAEEKTDKVYYYSENLELELALTLKIGHPGLGPLNGHLA